MRIGFIGAGKVGFSLGKYLSDHGACLTGYFSRNPESALEAANFTGTRSYSTIEELVQDSEVLFLTVPDGIICQVWEQLKCMQIKGKVICHCSGVLSSDVFSDKAAFACSTYSIHPLLAVNSKLHSYKELSTTLFTIEGDDDRKSEMTALIADCGNQVISLAPADKVRYHAAAVLASNLVLGLAQTAMEELQQCGFSEEAARGALAPFMMANCSHMLEHSLDGCLTGPVERADVGTVEEELDCLEGDNREIYRLLSKKALKIARVKNPERDYEKLEGSLS